MRPELRDPLSLLVGLRGIGLKWHGVKGGEGARQAYRGLGLWREFAARPRAEIACGSQSFLSIFPFPCVRAQKFMPQISVAVLDVHEIRNRGHMAMRAAR